MRHGGADGRLQVGNLFRHADDAANFSNQVLQVFLNVRSNGRIVLINFNNASGAGQGFGCLAQDCLAINFVTEE